MKWQLMKVNPCLLESEVLLVRLGGSWSLLPSRGSYKWVITFPGDRCDGEALSVKVCQIVIAMELLIHKV